MIKRTTGQQIRDSIYPVTKMITLKDITTKEELTVLTDRSQGGSSLSDGSLHLVIQR
jgi:alpha-mannosidase